MSRPGESVDEIYGALGEEIVAPFSFRRRMVGVWVVDMVGGGWIWVRVERGVVLVRRGKKGGGVFVWECGIEDPGVVRKARGVLKGIGGKRL